MLRDGIEGGQLAGGEDVLGPGDEFPRRRAAIFVAELRVVALDSLLEVQAFLHLKPAEQNRTYKHTHTYTRAHTK